MRSVGLYASLCRSTQGEDVWSRKRIRFIYGGAVSESKGFGGTESRCPQIQCLVYLIHPPVIVRT